MGFRSKLSETSDVFFSINRAGLDGFAICSLPPFVASRHAPIYAYMLAKYTLRWQLYRTATFLCCGTSSGVCEVVNPMRDCNLDQIASRTILTGTSLGESRGTCGKYGRSYEGLRHPRCTVVRGKSAKD